MGGEVQCCSNHICYIVVPSWKLDSCVGIIWSPCLWWWHDMYTRQFMVIFFQKHFRSIKSKLMAVYPDAFPDDSAVEALDRRPDLERPTWLLPFWLPNQLSSNNIVLNSYKFTTVEPRNLRTDRNYCKTSSYQYNFIFINSMFTC